MVYCSFMPGQITNLTGQKAILFGICPMAACYFQLCNPIPPDPVRPIRSPSHLARSTCSPLHCLSLDPPLSLDSIMDALEGVASFWRRVGETLHLPLTTFIFIELESVSDVERLRAVLRYWLHHDPHASWRMLIWRLDCYVHLPIGVADVIRSYTEPLTGQ